MNSDSSSKKKKTIVKIACFCCGDHFGELSSLVGLRLGDQQDSKRPLNYFLKNACERGEGN